MNTSSCAWARAGLAREEKHENNTSRKSIGMRKQVGGWCKYSLLVMGPMAARNFTNSFSSARSRSDRSGVHHKEIPGLEVAGPRQSRLRGVAERRILRAFLKRRAGFVRGP